MQIWNPQGNCVLLVFCLCITSGKQSRGEGISARDQSPDPGAAGGQQQVTLAGDSRTSEGPPVSAHQGPIRSTAHTGFCWCTPAPNCPGPSLGRGKRPPLSGPKFGSGLHFLDNWGLIFKQPHELVLLPTANADLNDNCGLALWPPLPSDTSAVGG